MATKIPKITIADVATGEFIEREMNEQELSDYNEYLLQVKADNDKKTAEAKIRTAAKTALLERLGITEDEAKLLLS